MTIDIDTFKDAIDSMTIDETLATLIELEDNAQGDNEEQELARLILAEELTKLRTRLSKQYYSDIRQHKQPSEKQKDITQTIYKVGLIDLMRVKLTREKAESDENDKENYQEAVSDYEGNSLAAIQWLEHKAPEATHPYEFRKLAYPDERYQVVSKPVFPAPSRL